eukprot:Tamp_21918.p1 GENE.Tamp_21918~~Tamp_21918.p1  ORF type:complete len:234 (-),score=16.33 Tamp_21918:67-768(-)
MGWVLYIELGLPMLKPSIFGKYVFLTTQTLTWVFLYVSTNMCCEFARAGHVGVKEVARIERLLHWLSPIFGGFAAFVFIMFYSVCWPNRKFQETVAHFESQGVPFGLYSHIMHCIPVPLAYIDTYFRLQRPGLLQSLSSVRSYVWFFVCYACFYVVVLNVNHSYTGEWPYPFLHRMTSLQRVLFYPTALGFIGILTLGCRRATLNILASSADAVAASSPGPRTRSQAKREKSA